MGVILANKLYTLAEFLAFEEQSDEKHEFHDGKIVSMSGGSFNHSVISTNMATALKNGLKAANKKCLVANSDLKIYIETANRAVFPDVMVICEAPKFVEDNENMIINPLVIIEVLSKSTKNYDKSYKFEYYRALPKFKEYVIIYQTIPKVQTWYKQEEDLWRISTAFGLESTIRLHSLNIELKLMDIYEWAKGLGGINDLSAY